MTSRLVPLPASVACLALLAAGAQAGSLTVRCQEELFDASVRPSGFAQMTLAYEGGASGVLTVGATFGDVVLPAALVEQDSEAAGEVTHVIGIRAAGPAEVLMPPKADIEACVNAAAKGEALDADLVAYHVNSCRVKAAPARDAVSATVTVDLTLLDGEGAALIGRTYAEPSALPGGRIRLDSWPMPECTLAGRD